MANDQRYRNVRHHLMEPNVVDPAPLLVVDDDADTRALLVDVLRENGHTALEAADGASALVLAERSRPSLILLDMRMPVMDGWQFAKAYRAGPGPHAPLLIITAAQNPAAWAADVQGIACMAKPFDMEELVWLVRSLLRTGSANGAAGASESDSATKMDETTDAAAEVSPLIGNLALLLLERQELVTRLTTAQHEPKPLVERLERNKKRTGALLTQIGALISPQGGPASASAS